MKSNSTNKMITHAIHLWVPLTFLNQNHEEGPSEVKANNIKRANFPFIGKMLHYFD